MLAHDYFDILCHLDLPKKFDEDLGSDFEDRLADILARKATRDLAVEVNTSGFDHPAAEAYPSTRVLSALKAAGIGVTVGSDAHRPEEIGRHFARAFDRIHAAGISHLALFTGRLRSEVPSPSVPNSLR